MRRKEVQHSFVVAKNFILLQAQAIDELKRCVLRASLISSQATAALASPTSLPPPATTDQNMDG